MINYIIVYCQIYLHFSKNIENVEYAYSVHRNYRYLVMSIWLTLKGLCAL